MTNNVDATDFAPMPEQLPVRVCRRILSRSRFPQGPYQANNRQLREGSDTRWCRLSARVGPYAGRSGPTRVRRWRSGLGRLLRRYLADCITRLKVPCGTNGRSHARLAARWIAPTKGFPGITRITQDGARSQHHCGFRSRLPACTAGSPVRTSRGFPPALPAAPESRAPYSPTRPDAPDPPESAPGQPVHPPPPVFR